MSATARAAQPLARSLPVEPGFVVAMDLMLPAHCWRVRMSQDWLMRLQPSHIEEALPSLQLCRNSGKYF
jgi:hypothetical protein